jgi:hypothetical protein
MNHYKTRIGIVACTPVDSANGARDRRFGASGKKGTLFFEERSCDRYYLSRAFAFAQDDLGKPLS